MYLQQLIWIWLNIWKYVLLNEQCNNRQNLNLSSIAFVARCQISLDFLHLIFNCFGIILFSFELPKFIQVFFETQWKEKKIVTVTFILGANMKIILNKVNIWMIQSVINTFELPLIYPLKISEGFLVFSGTMELEHWSEMG